MPLTIELVLVDDMEEPIIFEIAVGTNFDATNTSLTWSIINVQVKCDIVTLDSGPNEAYIKLLEEGKKLTLNYNTFSCGAGDFLHLYFSEAEFEYHMQIGSKLYPGYPIRSHAEAYYQL